MKITDVDYKYFIRYASWFYSNMGNVFDNGNSKMIPALNSSKFQEILKTSSKFEEIKYIWDCIKETLYDTSYNKNKHGLKRVNRNYFYLGDIKTTF
jgi:repressor of nif and glnA expression